MEHLRGEAILQDRLRAFSSIRYTPRRGCLSGISREAPVVSSKFLTGGKMDCIKLITRLRVLPGRAAVKSNRSRAA